MNGILGSLVAITATCACVHPPAALIIGLVGAMVALLVNDWIPGENVVIWSQRSGYLEYYPPVACSLEWYLCRIIYPKTYSNKAPLFS